MLYFLLFVSVFIDTMKNIYYNYFGKNRMQEPKDALLFNVVSCAGSVLFFIVCGAPLRVSGYSFLLAVCFAVVTAGAQYLSLMAMSLGSMSYSVLFTYLSMLIPTFFGILYYSQPVSGLQMIGLVQMLLTFCLSLEFKKDSAMTFKWLAAALGSFVCWGLVGVCQQLHQNSAYAGELDGFLLWTFLLSMVLFLVFYSANSRKNTDSCGGNQTGSKAAILTQSCKAAIPTLISRTTISALISKAAIPSLLSGIVIGAVNKINLYLSGRMPSVIFFPIVNGGVIILSGLAAILIFRERLSAKQTLGLLTGIVSVCLLGM